MPITDILEKNCRLYGDDVCLVEINPEMPETKRSTWKEYDLIEPSVHHITDAKLHGMYSMRKQIDLQICFWNAESKKGTRSESF